MRKQEQADEAIAVPFEKCRLCGGPALSSDPLVDGAHPLCEALRSLEALLDATDDPSIEDETYRYRKTVAALLTLWARLPRGEQEKTLHFQKCSLAAVNRMYALAYFNDDDDQADAFAALCEHGFEPSINCTFGEGDGLPPTICVDINGVSALRQHEFLDWLNDLLKPFGGYVHEAGFADPPRPDANFRPMLVPTAGHD